MSETAGVLDLQNNLPGDLVRTVALLVLLGGYTLVRGRRWGAVLLIVVALGHVAQSHALHRALNPTVPTAALSYRPEYLDLMRPPPGGRVYVYDYSNLKGRANGYLPAKPGKWQRLEGLDGGVAQLLTVRQYLSPLVGAFWNIEYAWDVDMRMLFDRRLAGMTIGVRRVEETPGFLKLLQISGVHRMVSLHDEGLAGLKLLAKEDFFPRPLQIFEVPDPLPRAFLVSGRRRSSGNDLRDLVDPTFDPRLSTLVERDPVRTPAAEFEGAATIIERRSDRIEIETRSSSPALLTLIDGAMPGWRAWIDDQPALVERTNTLFIGTEVPAGRHRVVFRFLPATAVVGVASTLLTCVLLAGSFLRSLSRGRSQV